MDFMETALSVAKKGIGKVSPNPLVGAVIVRENQIISTGYHERFGENHAERNAIINSKSTVENSTMYVTLEPCSHHGKTPPCTDLIINSKIKKVVIASIDPTKKVKGIEQLKNAGVEVEIALREEAFILNYEFFKSNTLPSEITIKVASSLDGKIATKSFNSNGISSKKMINLTHQLRKQYDAIMVGANTVLKDNPKLTIRDGSDQKIYRVVVDYDLNSNNNNTVFQDMNNQTILFTSKYSNLEKIKMFKELGVLVFNVLEGLTDLINVPEYLGMLGIKTVLLEGGGKLNEAFLEQNLVSKVRFHLSPIIIGGNTSITSFDGTGVNTVKEAYKLQNIKTEIINDEIIIEGEIDVHRYC